MTGTPDQLWNPELLATKAKHLRAMADAIAPETIWTWEKFKENWWAYLIGLAVALPMGVAGAVYTGWVLSIMWGWFIAPLGLPSITIPWAIGIMLSVGIFHKYEAAEDPPPPVHLSIFRLLKPAVLLGAGWVVKTFFM